MRKRLLLYLVVEAIVLAFALSIGQQYKDTALLPDYAVEISAYAERQESEARQWVSGQRPVLEAALEGGALEPEAVAQLESLAAEEYTLLIFREDSILFWSNSRALPRTQLAELAALPERGLASLPFGHYAVYHQPFGTAHLAVLIPLRYNLAEGTNGRQDLFPGAPGISDKVVVGEAPTPYAVTVGGQPLAWLDAAGSVQAAWVQWVKLLAYALFVFLLLRMLHEGALALSGRFGPWPGAVLLLGAMGGLYWLIRHYEFTACEFGNLPVFARRFEQPTLLGNSLGDWLISLALLLWAMVFFHRTFKVGRLDGWPLPARLATGTLLYFLMMGTVLFSVEMIGQLVYHSAINFDFDNLLNLGAFGFLALGSLVLLMAGLFLLGHRMMLSMLRLKLSLAQRAGALAVAAALLFALSGLLNPALQANAGFIAAFALGYVVLFDLFLHRGDQGFGWVVLWLLLFSVFSAFFLYRFSGDKDRLVRATYAEALTQPRDTALAEPQLARVYEELKRDSQLNRLLKPWPFKPATEAVRNHLNRYIYRENYLFQHYRVQAYAFDRENQPLFLDQTLAAGQVVTDRWDKARPLPDHPEIRFQSGDDGVFRYLFRLRADRMGDPTQPATVYAFLEHTYPQPTRVYSKLFYNRPYKDLELLPRYDFAVERNGHLVVEQGPSRPSVLGAGLDPGEAREVVTPDPPRIDAVQRSADGQILAAVGRSLGGWLKPVYLFSLLFTLSSIFVFGLALLNTYLPVLPVSFRFYLSTKGSLGRRIHYANVALIVVAFFVIGLLTYRHFSATARDAERGELDFRAEAIATHLRAALGDLSPASDSLRRLLPQTLAPLATSLSMDVNLYSPDGRLVYSSQQALQQLGIIPARLSAAVLYNLRQQNLADLTAPERLGGRSFQTRYLPLRNNQNQLLGFLATPYQLTERRIRPEVSDFIGMLASLYVFLLLIAGTATFLLARSIIRPVQLISDKIKELQFTDRNQPLEYQGDHTDELGELINEYNRMVDKLESSKAQMIRLEREGAWREMARQVAHDIKNPLTTMKLSMQQLERVSSNPEQAAAYLRKAITRLIEQIDSLAHIASEFSMFANLDIQQKHDVVLNDVVESVHDLFSEQKNVELSLRLPEDRYHIQADKNHLIRVFNNLIINGIQAIPSDRQGQIRVTLFRQGKQAVVQMSDNGGGIPPEIRDRVFEPNFTTKTSGSGLGLAICRKIIEALDGTIRFETREGDGTDFFVELPIVSVEAAERKASTQPSPLTS